MEPKDGLADMITRSQASAKSLRWLANQFPAPDTLVTNEDKMIFCIHSYCLGGATAIDQLVEQITKLNKGE